MICQEFQDSLKFFSCISSDKWSVIGTVLGGAGACFAGLIAWIQLGGLNKSLKTANITALLQIEAELNSRKKDLDNSMFKIMEAEKKLKIKSRKPQTLVTMIREYKTSLENYLNILDRLSNLILRGHLKDVVDWELDYSMQIKNLVETHTEELGSNTQYENIVALNRLWTEKKQGFTSLFRRWMAR